MKIKFISTYCLRVFKSDKLLGIPESKFYLDSGYDKYRLHRWELAWYRLKIKACKSFSPSIGTVQQPARYSIQETWSIQWPRMPLFHCRLLPD